MRTYKDDDLFYGDDMDDPDHHGNPVRLSREEFNHIMERTLRAMGDEDPERVIDQPEWDDEYDGMKYLTPNQCKSICKVGIKNYLKSKNGDSN